MAAGYGAICFGQFRQEKSFKDRISLDYRLSSQRIRWLVNKLSPRVEEKNEAQLPIKLRSAAVRLSAWNLLLKYIVYSQWTWTILGRYQFRFSLIFQCSWLINMSITYFSHLQTFQRKFDKYFVLWNRTTAHASFIAWTIYQILYPITYIFACKWTAVLKK